MKEKEPKSRIIKHKGNCRWKGVSPRKYKVQGKDWASVLKHMLVAGEKNERAKFHFRYLELGPGGFTSLETHRHEHVVLVIKGKGEVLLGKKTHKLAYLDTIYISTKEPHQLLNPYKEPFGFICVVDARRDRPRVIGGKAFPACESAPPKRLTSPHPSLLRRGNKR
jgi:quercetin dioxygenase-like cupin family protein